MYLIFSMILSGNMLLLFVVALRKSFGKCFDFRLQSILIKVCLFFLLVPLSLLRDLINLLIFKLHGNAFIGDFRLEGRLPTIIFTPGHIVTNSAMHAMLAILILWGILTCMVCGYHMVSYLKFRKTLSSSAEIIGTDSLCDFVKGQAKALRINRKIPLLKSSILDSAYTLGTIRPVIILPSNCSDAEHKIIILHELAHIKNHDTLFRFLCLICKGLYWFNPLTYLLNRLFSQTTELACDEWVAQQLDSESKILYAQLIISMARRNPLMPRYSSALTKDGEMTKKRIDCIMKKPPKSPLHHFASAAAAMAAVALCCIPALASPTPQLLHIESVSSEAISFDSGSDFAFYTGTEIAAPMPEYTLLYDRQFTTVDGTIHDAAAAPSRPYVNCTHIFADGTYIRHDLKSDGGCITRYQTARQCIKCECLRVGEVMNEVTYCVCPHHSTSVFPPT